MIPYRMSAPYIGSLLQYTIVLLATDIISRARIENQGARLRNGFAVNLAQSSQTSGSKSFTSLNRCLFILENINTIILECYY